MTGAPDTGGAPARAPEEKTGFAGMVVMFRWLIRLPTPDPVSLAATAAAGLAAFPLMLLFQFLLSRIRLRVPGAKEATDG